MNRVSPGIRGVLILLLIFCSATLLVACGTAKHPEDALEGYVSSVKSKDADAVYDMIGEDLRAGMSRAEFRTFFTENYDEILLQAESIEESLDREQMEIHAALPVDDHAEIPLEYAEGSWFLTDDVPAIAGATSPRGTLLALQEAVEQKDLDAILRLLSKEKADTLNAELNIIRSGLRDVNEDDIVVNGETATIYLDWGLKLELVFEEGSWRMNGLRQN